MLWPAVFLLARELQRPVRILDVATGGGDVAIGVAEAARRAGIGVSITGIDISPVAVQQARERARARRVYGGPDSDVGAENRFFAERNNQALAAQQRGVSVEFTQLDALRDELPGGFDVVTCSLFLHHLDAADAAELLRRMATATTELILVNDLMRTRLAWLGAYVGSRFLTRSRIVHVDGPLSHRMRLGNWQNRPACAAPRSHVSSGNSGSCCPGGGRPTGAIRILHDG